MKTTWFTQFNAKLYTYLQWRHFAHIIFLLSVNFSKWDHTKLLSLFLSSFLSISDPDNSVFSLSSISSGLSSISVSDSSSVISSIISSFVSS